MKKDFLSTTAVAIEERLREQGVTLLNARPFHGNVLLETNGEAFARFKYDAPSGLLQLGYYTHRGTWETMPFTAGTPQEAADLLLEVLGPHIQALTEPNHTP